MVEKQTTMEPVGRRRESNEVKVVDLPLKRLVSARMHVNRENMLFRESFIAFQKMQGENRLTKMKMTVRWLG